MCVVISQPESLELEELRLETDELEEQNSQLNKSRHAAVQCGQHTADGLTLLLLLS